MVVSLILSNLALTSLLLLLPFPLKCLKIYRQQEEERQTVALLREVVVAYEVAVVKSINCCEQEQEWRL